MVIKRITHKQWVEEKKNEPRGCYSDTNGKWYNDNSIRGGEI